MKRIVLSSLAVALVAGGAVAIVQAQRGGEVAENPEPRPIQRINPLREATAETALSTSPGNAASAGTQAAAPADPFAAPAFERPSSPATSMSQYGQTVGSVTGAPGGLSEPFMQETGFPNAEEALGVQQASHTAPPPRTLDDVIGEEPSEQLSPTPATLGGIAAADDRYAQAAPAAAPASQSGRYPSYERYPSYAQTASDGAASAVRHQSNAPQAATAADQQPAALVADSTAASPPQPTSTLGVREPAAAPATTVTPTVTPAPTRMPAEAADSFSPAPSSAAADGASAATPASVPTAPPPTRYEQPQPLAAQSTQQADVPSSRQPANEAAPLSSRAPLATAQTAAATGKPGDDALEGVQTPSLTIEKLAPAEVQIGKPALFEVIVRNAGSVPAHGVEVHDQVPQGTQLVATRPQATTGASGTLVWALGDLAPGDTTTVQMELLPTSEGEVGSVATVTFATLATARAIVTRPVLSVQVKAPEQVMIDEEALLEIEISNTGTGAATGVVVAENVPANLSHPAGPQLEYEIGTLAPGEKRQLQLVLTARQPGKTTNLLTARSDGQARAHSEVPMEVVAPALEVAMEGPTRRYLDRQATYSISVSNPGTAAAEEVELVAHLPKGLQFVETNNAGQYDPQTHAVYWLLEALPPRESGTVMLTALPIEAGEQKLRVVGTAERGLEDSQEESVLVEGVAAILFQVVDAADPIEVGGETSYEIRVVNQGSKAATNLQLIAVMPAEMEAISADGPTAHQLTKQEVRFEPLASLGPQAETTYQVRARGLAPGDLRIRMQLLSDDMRTPVTKEESTRIYNDQ